MASIRFTDVQARPSEFLDLTSLTTDEFQQINYHPQSGWFEDAPLKGGAVMGCPCKGRCCRKPSSEGTVMACPQRGRCCRKPSQRALL